MSDLRLYLERALEQLDKGNERQARNILRLAAMDDIKDAFAHGAIFLLHPEPARRAEAKRDLYAILYPTSSHD
jgi:Tfp pilus assembly protein PilF